MTRRISTEGLALIKSFEGLELQSYPDPGSGGEPFTIGYGHTGFVEPGDTISEEEAEELLISDLRRFEEGVDSLLPGLPFKAYSALVSFAYNVGLGALADSTLARRIKQGENLLEVIEEELPRWNKGASGVMPGLTRRRQAEVDLALEPESASRPREVPETPDTVAEPLQAPQGPSSVDLAAFFAHFDQSIDHQVEAVDMLQDAIEEVAPELLQNDAEWIRAYRDQIKKPAPSGSLTGGPVRLTVPYLYQLDSDTAHGARMCFSSACAMLVEGLEPGTLKGSHEDDYYLRAVFKYGDTTSAEAQIAALRSYGFDASFRVDGTSRLAKGLIRAGVPVPVGVLHKGPADRPHGGGHWIVLVGFDDKQQTWICHDPNGEMDVANGGYVSNNPTAGRYVNYSFKNLNKRWMVDGEGDGWMIEVAR